jgi:hypothetical protein
MINAVTTPNRDMITSATRETQANPRSSLFQYKYKTEEISLTEISLFLGAPPPKHSLSIANLSIQNLKFLHRSTIINNRILFLEFVNHNHAI